MNKIIRVSLVSLVPVFGTTAVLAAPAAQDLTWQAITFGQSTDLNFGSTILPEKVGTNEVTVDGEPVDAGPLVKQFTIESRGGKLANSHEGGTFYYTRLPTDVNFTIAATLTLEQLGPETGATPNRQEGAGIMVRDIIGAPRANPQPVGHEEFPAASNMVMNLLRSHSRQNDGLSNATAVYREGIRQPWGNPGNFLSKQDYVEGIEHDRHHHYRMTLTRTNEHFSVTLNDGQKTVTHTLDDAPANLVQTQDADHQYLGFFAARNARLSVSDVTLELSDADTDQSSRYQPPKTPLNWALASAEVTSIPDYTLQARANYAGEYQVMRAGQALAEPKKVRAGQLFQQPVTVSESTALTVTFKPLQGPEQSVQTQTLTVKPVAVADPMNLYVSPQGQVGQAGTKAQPLDLVSAIMQVAPGGTIHLASGDYPEIEIPLSASGRPDKLKRLTGEGAQVRFTGMVSHNANYWQLDHLEVAGERLIVHGSHNTFEHIVTHDAPDSGFQITSPRGIGRALWASHNTVRYSESYNNMDPSQINADGFAAKMRIGEGNLFDHCISHHNIDDGWDLFNKVEDGPNGAVTIMNSISFNNGQTLAMEKKGGNRGNGFKLGGEGLPVPHIVRNSLSFNNNMDGFTDNFNPGAITLAHNIAIDNKRFNYIVRQSPYEGELDPAGLMDNVSLRIAHPGQYPDTVHGDISPKNWFLKEGDYFPASDAPYDAATKGRIEALMAQSPSTEAEVLERALALQQLLFDH